MKKQLVHDLFPNQVNQYGTILFELFIAERFHKVTKIHLDL